MKKAITLILLVVTSPSFAQEVQTPKTYLEPLINIASTKVNGGNSSRGLQAGLSFQGGITSHFSLVSELYYLRKGGMLDETSFKLHAIELPVLARFHAGRYYLNAGPSLAYNLSASFPAYHRLEAGVQAGGGVEFPFKQKRIALDIRYAHGLTSIGHDRYSRALMVSVHFSKAWKNNPLAIKTYE